MYTIFPYYFIPLEDVANAVNKPVPIVGFV